MCLLGSFVLAPDGTARVVDDPTIPPVQWFDHGTTLVFRAQGQHIATCTVGQGPSGSSGSSSGGSGGSDCHRDCMLICYEAGMVGCDDVCCGALPY